MRKIHISQHARERYIQRVSSRNQHAHALTCDIDQCKECGTLHAAAYRQAQLGGRHLDAEIYRKVLCAIEADSRVTNQLFIETAAKRFPEKYLDFYQYQDAVFIIATNSGLPAPTLITVLTSEMMDGFVINQTPQNRIGKVMDRWKLEVKLKSKRIVRRL